MDNKTQSHIREFKNEYRFLSNFWYSKVVYEGVRYSSVEHAFQAAKTLDLDERKEIQQAKTCGEAKRLGRSVTLREDWEQIKLFIMEYLVRQKFLLNKDLGQKLLDTGNSDLIKGNYWGDTFWGVCLKEGRGQNNLGKILMKVRTNLQNNWEIV